MTRFAGYERLQGEERQKYFASLEQTWTATAQEKKMADQLVVVDSKVREDPGLYDVLYIDTNGKAKRIGGYAGTDFGGGGPFVGQAIEKLGPEGIQIFQKSGFAALVERAKSDVFRAPGNK